MFDVRIEDKPAFTVMGRKSWVPIEKSEDYGTLFQEAHGTGLVEKLMNFNNGQMGCVTNAAFLGVARIYGDPADGNMDYYIAAEVPDSTSDSVLESFSIPASKWAILQSNSVSLEEMSSLEVYGYTEWLPGSGYKLTNCPQMNAFLRDGDREYTELWLPITENKEEIILKIRSYLTYNGTCGEAIELYKKAFKTETIQVMRFSDMPPNPNFQIPDEYKDRIMQCMLKFGDDYIRMSDCGPGQPLNDPESERISLVIETSIEDVKYGFDILAEEGHVGMPLAETFYSPCAGVVFDKFGVMWNFAAQK